MKRNFILSLIALLFAAGSMYAQSSFSMQHDTVSLATGGAGTAVDGIINPGTAPVSIQWKLVSTNFPADWKDPAGVCDISSCFTGSAIFGGSTHTCNYGTGTHDFHMLIDQASTTTTGTYYMTFRLNNAAIPTDTALATFVVTKFPTAVTQPNTINDITMYPNPASNELNVVFDAGADVKNITVYNIIGKAMKVYLLSGNSANLDITNMPAGVYFIRLQNNKGDILATRKFMKQ